MGSDSFNSYLQPSFVREGGGSRMIILRNKRAKRLQRWRQLAEVALNLPEQKPSSAARRLIQWMDSNKVALEAGLEVADEELPGGGFKDTGIWAQFQGRVDKFSAEALGMHCASALSIIGMTAMERELMSRLNNAGVNMSKGSSKIDAEQLRRVEKKLLLAEGTTGGGGATRIGGGGLSATLPPRLPHLEMSTALQTLKESGKGRGVTARTAKSLDDASLRSTLTRNSRNLPQKRMSGNSVDLVSKETIQEWLREPAIDAEKRFAISTFQNNQWRSLYDAKHDATRIKQQRLERMALQGLKKLPKVEVQKPPLKTAASGRSQRSRIQSMNSTQVASPVQKESVAELKAKAERDRELKLHNKRLQRRLRNNLQAKFTKTQTLPMDLFKAFKKYDADNSGAIDFDEFTNVCDFAGLGAGVLSREDQRTLFEQADMDGGGTVDFAEFLKVVVGNLVSI